MRRIKIKHISSTRFQHMMYKPKERLYNCVWTFHKYDRDFFPSVPHGHSGKYVLSVLDGIVYLEKDHIPTGHAKKKELKRLQSSPKFQEFALEHIRWYQEEFPNIPVEIPSWLEGKRCVKNHASQGPMNIQFTVKIVMDSKK